MVSSMILIILHLMSHLVIKKSLMRKMLLIQQILHLLRTHFLLLLLRER